MKKTEFAVGEVFQFGLKKLKVELKSNFCSDCYFDKKDNACPYVANETGPCMSTERSDGESVVFVEVKDEE